jgi:hypothetical protein
MSNIVVVIVTNFYIIWNGFSLSGLFIVAAGAFFLVIVVGYVNLSLGLVGFEARDD